MNATVKWQAQRHQHLEELSKMRSHVRRLRQEGEQKCVCSVVAIVRKRPAGSGGAVVLPTGTIATATKK